MIDLRTPIIPAIEKMVEDIPGWTPMDQLQMLFALAYSTAPLGGDIVEIGSWCGRSSSVLGVVAQLTPGTTVHCIDLFPEKSDWYANADGTYSFRLEIGGKVYGGYEHQTVWREPYEQHIVPLYERYAGIQDAFREYTERAGVAGVLRSYKGDSGILRSLEGLKCRLAFVDGDHGYDAVCEDIENVERILLPGGWICFDDAFSSYDGVNRAIEDRIVASGNFVLARQMTRKLFVARKK